MATITRLNLTANGPLHVGHAYMALINADLAHTNGGRFIVRWEDSALSIQHLGAARIATICACQRHDLNWLGIGADYYEWQSATIDKVNTLIHDVYGYDMPADATPIRTPRVIGADELLYPYTPTLTAQKVVFDHLSGVNLLVRGNDLLPEYSLYQHYCWLFGLIPPEHIYLPRLRGPYGAISKTHGGYTIAELRAAGYAAVEVRDWIARACLQHAANGWTLDNLRSEPRLSDAP